MEHLPSDVADAGAPYTHEPLSGPEIFDLRTRWTARNASPATGIHELQARLDDAQYDIARLLRHLDALKGPPELNK